MKTVLCPRQKVAYGSQTEALHASKAVHRHASAHVCPTCGFWHAGASYAHCPSRKVPHGSQAEAQVYADRLNAKPDGWGTAYPYECTQCGQWHTGRPHKGKTLQ